MSHSPLWRARTEALTHLENNRAEQTQVLDTLFAQIDRCIDVYEASANTNTYARICGLTVLKAKNLAIGAYSLILDGLAQEAGALLRPFIEYAELLTYLKRFPEKANNAASNDLPSAGERAKAINGSFKQFRDYLNQHASHSSYSHYSLGHLVEPGTLNFRKLQRMVPEVVDRNIRDLAVQLYLLLYEAVMGLETFAMDDLRAIGGDCDDLKERMILVFHLGDV
jgi:hypothetical protein